jgi:hypothetical protein
MKKANLVKSKSVKADWSNEIKYRVDDIRMGRVKTISGERVLREIAREFPDTVKGASDSSGEH